MDFKTFVHKVTDLPNLPNHWFTTRATCRESKSKQILRTKSLKRQMEIFKPLIE